MIDNSEYSMEKQDSEGEDKLSNILTHDQILLKIEEIKEFENNFTGYQINEIEVIQGDIKVDQILDDSSSNENKNLNFEKDLANKPSKSKNFKLFSIKIKRRKKENIDKPLRVKQKKKKLENRILTPNTINIGFDKNGDLVNLDLRKPKIKEGTKSKFKNLAVFKKLPFKRKSGESASNNETPESATSRASKIKGVFGKIGNLKRAIPHKGKREKKE